MELWTQKVPDRCLKHITRGYPYFYDWILVTVTVFWHTICWDDNILPFNPVLNPSVTCFRYVDDLFKLDSSVGSGNLKQFEEVINQETFWVATEILKEPNTLKRMKTIKHFIKIALHCRECKNFNSMFAIIRLVQCSTSPRLFVSFILHLLHLCWQMSFDGGSPFTTWSGEPV